MMRAKAKPKARPRLPGRFLLREWCGESDDPHSCHASVAARQLERCACCRRLVCQYNKLIIRQGHDLLNTVSCHGCYDQVRAVAPASPPQVGGQVAPLARWCSAVESAMPMPSLPVPLDPLLDPASGPASRLGIRLCWNPQCGFVVAKNPQTSMDNCCPGCELSDLQRPQQLPVHSAECEGRYDREQWPWIATVNTRQLRRACFHGGCSFVAAERVSMLGAVFPAMFCCRGCESCFNDALWNGTMSCGLMATIQHDELCEGRSAV